MKLAGFLLMPAGWIIALAALVLLPSSASRTVFVLAGSACMTVTLLVWLLVSHSTLPEATPPSS